MRDGTGGACGSTVAVRILLVAQRVRPESCLMCVADESRTKVSPHAGQEEVCRQAPANGGRCPAGEGSGGNCPTRRCPTGRCPAGRPHLGVAELPSRRAASPRQSLNRTPAHSQESRRDRTDRRGRTPDPDLSLPLPGRFPSAVGRAGWKRPSGLDLPALLDTQGVPRHARTAWAYRRLRRVPRPTRPGLATGVCRASSGRPTHLRRSCVYRIFTNLATAPPAVLPTRTM